MTSGACQDSPGAVEHEAILIRGKRSRARKSVAFRLNCQTATPRSGERGYAANAGLFVFDHLAQTRYESTALDQPFAEIWRRRILDPHW